MPAVLLAEANPQVETAYYIVAIIAALAAFLVYLYNVNLERAKWASKLYEDFEKNPQLQKARNLFDCQRETSEIRQLVLNESPEVTTYLNYFEFVGHLIDSHQLTKKHVGYLFGHYLGCLSSHPSVGAYVDDPANSYERLAELLAAQRSTPVRFFFYGTLLPDQAPRGLVSFLQQGTRIGAGTVRGNLYAFSDYPAAVIDSRTSSTIRGEVYEFANQSAILNALDDYEGYLREDPQASLFVRKSAPVELDDGRRLPCWIYIYNRGDLNDSRPIDDGDYRRWISNGNR
jgi:gamma-glutamylcyclotransferase (GGCT)/AIG2-like uncharacterized protein YtfP